MTLFRELRTYTPYVGWERTLPWEKLIPLPEKVSYATGPPPGIFWGRENTQSHSSASSTAYAWCHGPDGVLNGLADSEQYA
jgi:hypothetical protein